MSSNASQSGRSKRKRRGGVNRKKRAMFQQQGGPFFRDGYADSNSTPLPAGGPRGFSIPHTPYPGEDFKPQIDFPSLPGSMPEPPPPSRVLEDYHVPVPLKSEVRSPVVADRGFPPTVSETKEAAPGLFGAAPPVPSEKPSSIPLEAAYTAPPEQERPESSVVEAAVSGAISELPQSTSTNKPGPPHSSLSELPRLIIPSPEPPDSPMYSPQDLFLEVASPDSLVPSQSTLFSPVPVAVATPQPMPSEPSAEPSSTPQSLPVLSLPGATTSSPVSSAAPTPSLQTPSPPHVAPEVIVAAPAVQEPEDELVPKSPVSSALHAAGVPAAVRPDGGIFPVSAKEPEFFGEALHIVIDARRLVDIQSRGERVNPILFSNCTIAPASPEEPAPSAHAPAQEVAAGERNRGTIRAFDTHVRNSLVANMAARQETVDEKVTRLRKEYLALHKEWVARCADLDESHKVDAAAGEVAAIPARTTRRSAAVLGDAVRSDLEMEQIIASLGNDELYDPAHLALRNVAVIPDMISVTHGKVDAMFDDTNNLVRDPQTFYDPIPSLAEWTSEEVEIFKQRFAKWPKQFGHIAAGLEHKTQAQCVQFYYLHKKTLIDFREAITTYGQSKRRRGGRKTDKKKGGLIADIRQHDAEVSKEQDPVKRRAGATTRKRREPTAQPPKRTAPRRSATAAMQQEEQTPAATPTPDPEPAPTPPVPAPAPDPPARPKRRRNNRAGAGAAAETDSAATEEPPAKRRRAPRKSKLVVSETSTPEPTKAASEAPAETASVPVEGPSEQPTQRRSSAWSADDIEQFLGLLAQYGKDFKRIAASMPNKTTMQVGNFYTANLDRYDLKPIAAKAPGRSPTPNPPPETKEETPQPSTSAPGVVHEQAFTISDVPPISTLHLFS
ncbi:hypothetical protein BC834DRAFT_975304 [Gloeopeniophorella convolvens]|nr:hypothetical protein BC834DRAFT_975304 [Gloeopeniophorella convolvens]